MDEKTSQKEINNYIKNIPIQLCNVCNTTGDLMPRWFRFEDEEHQIHTIKVVQIASHKEINFVGIKMMQFICRTCEEGERAIENLVELRYNILAHKWFFFQLLS